jgi:hypothetical protein
VGIRSTRLQHRSLHRLRTFVPHPNYRHRIYGWYPSNPILGATCRRYCANQPSRFPSNYQLLYKISKAWMNRIVLAHCVGRYFQCNERLRVSFQGKPLEWEIDLIQAVAPDTTDLEADLDKLSIQEEPMDWTSGEEVVLQALSSSSSGVKVYKMTYDTTVDFFPPRDKYGRSLFHKKEAARGGTFFCIRGGPLHPTPTTYTTRDLLRG